MSEKSDPTNWANKSGEFKRQVSLFRDFISTKPGSRFQPEAGRYHLYVSLACPWAHRTLIARVLKGLQLVISVSIVHWHMDKQGWRFINDEEIKKRTSEDDVQYGTVDHLYNSSRIREIYYKANPDYSARFTVPVLWDTKEKTIVNNESSEILRIFNSGFNSILPKEYAEIDLYPEEDQAKIDELNGWIYDNINNGVYKAGFATSEEPYVKEVINLFKHLDKVEALLKDNAASDKKFLLGNTLTEADVRLYTTIVRFDPVYHQHFKCNIGMIRHDYPYINNWVRLLYWKIPGFKETTDFDHIKLHYTKSHPQINPFGITPVGPIPNILPE